MPASSEDFSTYLFQLRAFLAFFHFHFSTMEIVPILRQNLRQLFASKFFLVVKQVVSVDWNEF